MKVDKNRLREVKRQIRKVLLEEWDPIGIVDMGGPEDEYDAYIGPIFTALSKRSNQREVADLLRKIEMERMEYASENSDHLLQVAQSLLRIDVTIPGLGG